MTLAEIAARHDIARREECPVPLSIAALICDDVPELIGWVRRLGEYVQHKPHCPALSTGEAHGACTCRLAALLAEVRG